MKKLLLIRHAKSSWEDENLSDFDRPLNERGKKDAPRMGKRMKERNIFPDVMITSPAVRAHSTCKKMAQVLDFPETKIKVDKRLYHASADQILRVVQDLKDLDDEEEVVMLFGHNPGLTEFVQQFLQAEITNIPTCGVVGAHLAIGSWHAIKAGSVIFDFFDFPKSRTD